MKLRFNNKEVDLCRTDIECMASRYKDLYKEEINNSTVSELRGIEDSSIVEIDATNRIINIDSKPLTYTHKFILATFVREHKAKLGIKSNSKFTEDALVSVCAEQLKNINKQCATMTAELSVSSQLLSHKTRVKYIDMYNNISLAVNRLILLAGSYSECDERNFKAFCDCSDLMIDLREQINKRTYRVKKKEVS